MKRACEPVHIQLNLDDSAVAVVNRSYQSQQNLTAEIKLYNVNSRLLFNKKEPIHLHASEVKKSVPLENLLLKADGISFVFLQLRNSEGKTISQNVYWFSPEHNFKNLKQMPFARLKAKILKTEKLQTETKWTIQISNTTNQLAFFVNPQLTENGKEILPSFWSDNYFSLAPNESTIITVSIPDAKINGQKPSLALSGWNVEKEFITW